MTDAKPSLCLQHLGIDTYKEAVIYMRKDCQVCLSEGFEVQTRVRVSRGDRSIIATLHTIKTDLLDPGHVSLSEYAWKLLAANEGDAITVSHAQPVQSLSFVRSKIYGNKLPEREVRTIIKDIVGGRYSDIHISAFLTGCAGGRMDIDEIINLTKAMIDVGDRLTWHSDIIVDKHSVGGLPGNRTTPIVVAIVADFGLTMPKTSSRAITSPAGTADTMEVLTAVKIDLANIKKIVGKENGCFVWGGAISLSPADEILIRVEKALDLDSEGQLVASVLSKKISAGATHVLIDIPIGPTAKVRSQEMANIIRFYFETVGQALGITVKVLFSDGSQPVGRGIGPALEARDVLEVLQGKKAVLSDLRARSLTLAAYIIEFSPDVATGQGLKIATNILDTGRAWEKFKAICKAQGGLHEIPRAPYVFPYTAKKDGVVINMDNRRLSMLAKLSGAPTNKVAGIDLHTYIGNKVRKGDELFAIHANSPGELEYALGYLGKEEDMILIEKE